MLLADFLGFWFLLYRFPRPVRKVLGSLASYGVGKGWVYGVQDLSLGFKKGVPGCESGFKCLTQRVRVPK